MEKYGSMEVASWLLQEFERIVCPERTGEGL